VDDYPPFLPAPFFAINFFNIFYFSSIIEPIRNFVFEHANDLHISSATGIDFAKKIVTVQSALSPNMHTYPIEYDKLVIGVGSLPGTFGVPGVRENCYFLKVFPFCFIFLTNLCHMQN
jgi:NADH dehydrogenase FAD-containing subunit